MHPMLRRGMLVGTFAVVFSFVGRADITPQGAAGDLDLAFSDDGRAITDIGGSDYGRSVAIQADGKLVVVGGTYAADLGRDEFALARYNSDGSLDPTFSGDGRQASDFGMSADAWAVAIDADGKIVVGGQAGADFALARYNPDGELDPTFSDDGKQTIDFAGETDAAYGIALQSDGAIVAVGNAGASFAIARILPDGSLDTSFPADKFPADGKQTTGFSGRSYARAVSIQADGKIVAAGSADADFALARYNTDGSLDTTFSEDGRQTTDFGADEEGVSAVAIQADGKIVAVGQVYSFIASAQTIALARYNPDGSLDATFAREGLKTTALSGTDWASGVSIQSDGRIVAVGGGLVDAQGESDFVVVRYNRDGSLDTSFSDDGIQTTDFGGNDEAYGVALQLDGRIVAVGGSGTGDFALARYEGGSGAPDTIPPETVFTGGPMATGNDSTPTFAFAASEQGSSFECRIDNTLFLPCSSPHTTSILGDGPHTFDVRATDSAGNADPSPASRSFSIDTAPPETAITDGPTGASVDQVVTFRFDSSEIGSTFECTVDGSGFSPCSSPHGISPLGDGSHSFEVRAIDAAGNTDASPAMRSWSDVVTYAQAVLATPGLISYWRLGDKSTTTARDATGVNNGAYRNGVLLDRPGALLNDVDASASFDGSNDFVSVADSASLHLQASFTLEAWVKRSHAWSSTETVLSKGSSAFRLSFDRNVLTLSKSTSTVAKASIATTDTAFHHIAATKSGVTVKIYIDGIDRTGTYISRTIASTSTPLNIGRDTSASEYFAGSIDEVAVYNVALTALQIQQHFKASGR